MAYIVMTSSAKMPSSVKHPYRNVAVVEIDDPAIYPAMISEHARNVRRIVRHFGPRATGKTERCAYRVALAEAETMAAKLNADEIKTA